MVELAPLSYQGLQALDAGDAIGVQPEPVQPAAPVQAFYALDVVVREDELAKRPWIGGWVVLYHTIWLPFCCTIWAGIQSSDCHLSGCNNTMAMSKR